MGVESTTNKQHLAQNIVHVKRTYGYAEAEKIMNHKLVELSYLVDGDVFGELFITSCVCMWHMNRNKQTLTACFKVYVVQWFSKLAVIAMLSARAWVQVPPTTSGVIHLQSGFSTHQSNPDSKICAMFLNNLTEKPKEKKNEKTWFQSHCSTNIAFAHWMPVISAVSKY